MSHWITTTNFITKVKSSKGYKINSINFFQRQGIMFEDIRAIAELELVIRWQNRLLYWFYVCVCKCCDKQESPPAFLLSNKGKGENNRKRPFESFLSKGLDYGKERCQNPFRLQFSTVSQMLSSFSNTLCFVCFKKYF